MVFFTFKILWVSGEQEEDGGGAGGGLWTMFQWSAAEIHLPQLLNEEAIAEEFSNWEQVSFVAAERFVHRPSPPLARLRPLPSAFPHNLFPSLSE